MDPEAYLISQPKGMSLSNEPLLELLQGTLEKGYSLCLRVRGFSMFPCFLDNDILTVSPWDPRTSCLGMAVAFIHPVNRKLIIQKVVRQCRDTCVIKGDALFSPDGVVPLENILGIITRIKRNGRGVRFDSGCGKMWTLFLNRTNAFAAFFRIGMFFPRPIRQGVKADLLR